MNPHMNRGASVTSNRDRGVFLFCWRPGAGVCSRAVKPTLCSTLKAELVSRLPNGRMKCLPPEAPHKGAIWVTAVRGLSSSDISSRMPGVHLRHSPARGSMRKVQELEPTVEPGAACHPLRRHQPTGVHATCLPLPEKPERILGARRTPPANMPARGPTQQPGTER